MHDGLQYDPIQGQGHEPKLEIWPFLTAISSAIYNGSRQLNTDSETRHKFRTISKFGRAGFLIFGLVFLCHVTLKLAETSVVKSQPSVPYGANLLYADFDKILLLPTTTTTSSTAATTAVATTTTTTTTLYDGICYYRIFFFSFLFQY